MPVDLLGGLTNEMLVTLVDTRYRKSVEYHQKLFRKVRDWYNLYRCIYTGVKPSFKNAVMLPLLFSACWSDVANKCAISLGNSRIVEFDAIDPQGGPSAKRTEALINQQLLDAQILEKMIDFLMSADVYGTGIVRTGWHKDVVPYTYRDNILGVEVPRRVNVTTFDGPDLENVDILDFLPQEGKKTIETMAYACHRYYADLDDLMEQAFVARQNGEEPKFDEAALNQLRQQPPSEALQQEINERQQVWRSYAQYEAVRQDRYSKPVELIDHVGLVPSEYAPDGVRLRIITIANRRVALRNVATPNWNLRKHFRTYCPMPDMHYFHGAGKVEIGATMAAAGNKLVSNRLDVLDLVLNPAIFVSDATEMDTQNLVLWPGRVIKVHGETGEAQIRPVQFDLSAYPLVVNELESISRYIDMGTGVQRDTIQGLLGGDRQTAREFLGRMEQARTRLGLESKLFERAILEGVAMDFRAYDRQYLTMPRTVALIGSAALINPDTGEPLPPELEQINLSDINTDHRARAIGASNMLTKTMQRQDMITALQAMQSNPYALQLTNWVSFFSKFWRAYDFDPREMMKLNGSPMATADMAQQLGAGGGAVPAGGGTNQDLLQALSSLQGSANMLGMAGGPRAALNPLSGIGAGLQTNMGV